MNPEEKFEFVSDLKLPTCDEMREQLKYLNSDNKKLTYLYELRDKAASAIETDSLIAEMYYVPPLARCLDKEISNWERVKRINECSEEPEQTDESEAWICEADGRERLFKKLEQARFGHMRDDKFRWSRYLTELAFLCKCLMMEEPAMIRWISSKGEFAYFVFRWFEWKKPLKRSSLEQTWTTSKEPGDESGFEQEAKKKLYTKIREIVRDSD